MTASHIINCLGKYRPIVQNATANLLTAIEDIDQRTTTTDAHVGF